MTTGQTNLLKALSSVNVSCDEVEYGFATIPFEMEMEIVINDVLGTFKEAEGTTIIASKDYLSTKGIPFEGPFAKLTIDIHTSLELVGITALLTNKLAEIGLPGNVVAAYYYDHVFVQYDLRHKAIEALNAMKEALVALKRDL